MNTQTMATGDAGVARPSAGRWRQAFYRFNRSWVSWAGLVIIGLLCLAAIAGPALAPYPQDVQGAVHTALRFQAPSWQHWFGTNEFGQDVFSLVLAGARISLVAGFLVVCLGALVGIVVGGIAGFAGGWIDEILMRLVDLVLTLPGLILAMAIAAALGAGLGNTIFAIALSWWPGYARLVRGEVIARKEEMFVQAARALGASPARILWRHVLPNVMSPVLIKLSLDMGFAILSVASLSFLGIGVKPPTPEWGSLLATARNNLPDFWWTALFPGLCIFFAVLGFNLLGDGLRDVLDPKSRR
ncbi:D-ala-D-ala transporter subunit [Bordetella genomosp. 8]|uniref:D-ala-D-ala transporter subunit n=1 Tax=Bordetella genomosp. 8 TaxID=1416806 RepID=A0A1W6YPG4_9BORD|nr:ABC transporter permease [Bordetella genomosp. 8]ARP82884.1 D-ala-D-ala transporter subunit [Bordetella genomosp. 8]